MESGIIVLSVDGHDFQLLGILENCLTFLQEGYVEDVMKISLFMDKVRIGKDKKYKR